MEHGTQIQIKERVKASIHTGDPIKCTKEEYPLIRKALHQLAGEYIDDGDTVRGSIALWEVRRLDEKHLWKLRSVIVPDEKDSLL